MNEERVAERAKQYTEHDIIRRYTELPQFPELRAKLLYACLRHSSLTHQDSELYALVASLAQLGLDTHDRISLTNERKEKKEARSRQLKVLAGDYFSSRYYHLLSQAGKIEPIRLLAQAICEVNRLKMILYTRMKQLKLTAEEYLQQTVGIHSHIFANFGRLLMDGSRVRVWPELVQSLVRCEVILSELKRNENVAEWKGGWAYWHILQSASKEERKQVQQEEPEPNRVRLLMHKYNVTALLWQLFDQQSRQMSAIIEQLDAALGKDLKTLLDPLIRLPVAPMAADEL
ncbi:heptaprenyl diphosphate synthase component 1 [Paenibacillus thermoaerophilus]|uniref:Heptaprenyl diphosphate synthase component 1 n=1 Tax=Paenibacillus thermoaerophilus TaxID=1215385 RepID=A0ABW2V5E3_9BACL|nr:heptaprenyl diphosphate synthase component 1 [Paenibacillus thermoaerophilus]TMV18712.1 heptaprenyl diphosphate synthase [Paenibacillus thermoaerophilus]